MNKQLKVLTLIASMGLSGAANAATIPGLFNTGVNDTPALLAGGSVDPHYSLISSADPSFPGPNAIVADPIAAGYWVANSATSQWIAPAANQGYPTGAAAHPAGDYTYRLTFNLTGLDPGTASISGNWAADNSGAAILLNGVSTGNAAPGYSPLASFFIGTGFVSGINTLEFVVTNLSASGSNPTGLRVAGISGTAELAAVPVPAAMWLFGSGLLGLIGIARRKVRSMTSD